MSICWKAVPWDFYIIENFLVWNIENGYVVSLGVDPWVGCKWRHIFPPYVIEKLHLDGIFFLNDIGVPGLTCLRVHRSLSPDSISCVDPHEIVVWNGYLAIIKANHVSISNEDDVLLWNLFKSGHYTTNYGYAQLMMDREVEYS